MEKTTLRAYFFGNMYVSSIQQGIQAGHVIGDMAAKYCPDQEGFTEQGQMFYDWATDHKVMILLNAGYGINIVELDDFFEGTNDNYPEPRLSSYYDGYSPYPFAMFRESDEALNGAATSFGCVLPEKIFEGQNVMRKVKRLRRDDIERIRFEDSRILTFKDGTELQYNDWEIELMERLGQFRLAQ